jgi:antitoxin (DNA-binding transcriptional repressor) of toxin-antitoxin stability system
MSQVKNVSVKEFRENLAEHINAGSPVAVTRHGFTVGYFIPTRKPVEEADKQALMEASRRLSQLLEEQGLNPEDLIKDAIALRKQDKRKRHG